MQRGHCVWMAWTTVAVFWSQCKIAKFRKKGFRSLDDLYRWRIQGGGEGEVGWWVGRVPSWPKNYLFHAVFHKFGKIICLCSPWRVGAPSHGESWIHPCLLWITDSVKFHLWWRIFCFRHLRYQTILRSNHVALPRRHFRLLRPPYSRAGSTTVKTRAYPELSDAHFKWGYESLNSN